jgi:hypothetical protein
MKKFILLVFLMNITTLVFCVDIFISFYDTIRITDNKLYYWDLDEFNEPTEEYDITWEKMNKIEYITFNYTGNFLNRDKNKSVSKGIKRYLIIYGEQSQNGYYGYCDFILLYDNNNELVFAQYSKQASNSMANYDSVIRATSEYRERNITYSVYNLFDIEKLHPWVEASEGNGVGEKIYIEYNKEFNPGGMSQENILKWRMKGIIISNGFVDYNRPYLYEYNNRIKRIRIYYEDLNEFMDIDLEDTPQIQYVQFDKLSSKIRIEILDVYRGERWNDTCVNMILPYADIWSIIL